MAKVVDVVFSPNGTNKVGAIKMLRLITGLGLKEAKDVIDTVWREFDTHLELKLRLNLAQLGLYYAMFLDPSSDHTIQDCLYINTLVLLPNNPKSLDFSGNDVTI